MSNVVKLRPETSEEQTEREQIKQQVSALFDLPKKHFDAVIMQAPREAREIPYLQRDKCPGCRRIEAMRTEITTRYEAYKYALVCNHCDRAWLVDQPRYVTDAMFIGKWRR